MGEVHHNDGLAIGSESPRQSITTSPRDKVCVTNGIKLRGSGGFPTLLDQRKTGPKDAPEGAARRLFRASQGPEGLS